MEGYANYISGGTLIITVDVAVGSGSHNAWNFSIAGIVGATGATGAQGSSGVVTVNAPLTNAGTSSAADLSISAGTTSAAGALQLTDSVASTSITTAATPNAVKSAYDLAVLKNPVLKLRSGAYMRTPYQVHLAQSATNQRVYYTPIFVPSTTTFDRLAIRTATTFVGTSSVRLGIFNDTDGLPSTVVLDAGTVSCTTNGTNFEITISQSLTPGFYWLAFVQQSAATTSDYIGAVASGASFQNYYIMSQANPGANGQAGWIQSSVSGAFSTATSLSVSTTAFYTWIRAA
jgi:hypothetical protein